MGSGNNHGGARQGSGRKRVDKGRQVVKISTKLLVKVRRLAVTDHITISEVVERAIAAWFDGHGSR